MSCVSVYATNSECGFQQRVVRPPARATYSLRLATSRCRNERRRRPGSTMIGTPGALDRYVPPSVFALTGGAPLRSGRASAAEHEEVVRDHAEAHPAMHPIQAAVATAGESMAVL